MVASLVPHKQQVGSHPLVYRGGRGWRVAVPAGGASRRAQLRAVGISGAGQRLRLGWLLGLALAASHRTSPWTCPGGRAQPSVAVNHGKVEPVG